MTPTEVVVWTGVVIFVVTAAITLGALVGWIRCLGGGDCSHHHYYLKALFATLILEITGTSVTAYAFALNSKDRTQLQKITEEIRTAAADETLLPVLLAGNAAFPKPTIDGVLQQKAYATSDGLPVDEKVVKIPSGWRYVSYDAFEWTKNGDASFSVIPVEDPKTNEITALKFTATTGEPRFFGPRNWIGVDLAVTMEKKQ